MKNVAGQLCTRARTLAAASAGGARPGRRVKQGKPFTLSVEHGEVQPLCAHVQISVYH